MKFLGHVHSKDGLRSTTALLRSKGIPTYVRYSGAPAILATPYRAAIYVCLDQHYNDALTLLRDPSHRVSEPVDVAEYERLAQDAPMSPLILKWSLVVLVGSFLLLASAVFFYRHV